MVSVMTERIGKDLFAAVMRMPSRDRYDILEYLGQSPVLPEAKSLVSKRPLRGESFPTGSCPVVSDTAVPAGRSYR
jgi:hypothetical protein